MQLPLGFLKWVSGLIQDLGVGFIILGIGSLIFNQTANEGSPIAWGFGFLLIGWMLVIASGIIEMWLVLRDKGK